MESECIYCGTCLLVCPQNAKYINSDLPKVKSAIQSGEKLYVSLAPSYIAAFQGARIATISAALKKLGFAHVEETAIGAAVVTREYGKLIAAHKMKNIISTACPSINLLIEKYFPCHGACQNDKTDLRRARQGRFYRPMYI
jgi:iron only hydrogenase large subunit-like protein